MDLTGTITKHKPGRKTVGTPKKPRAVLTADDTKRLVEDLCLSSFDCNDRVVGAVADPVPGAPAATVTIGDLARFLPATTGLHAEPDGWAVVGVPANLWIAIEPAIVPGELLGKAAQVRFTPIAYRFDYGDGTVRTTANPGRSWAALGQEELTATPTSHVYTDRAARRVSVTVVYSAGYRFAAGPWTGVAGAVNGVTPPQRVLVVVERTALTTPG